MEQNDEPTSETVDISTQDDIILTVQDRESIEEEDSSEEDFTEEASIPFGLDIPKKDKFRVNNDTTTGSPATPIVEAVVAEIESQEKRTTVPPQGPNWSVPMILTPKLPILWPLLRAT